MYDNFDIPYFESRSIGRVLSLTIGVLLPVGVGRALSAADAVAPLRARDDLGVADILPEFDMLNDTIFDNLHELFDVRDDGRSSGKKLVRVAMTRGGRVCPD